MNLFRNLLFWLVLALAGALVAQLLVQDPGQVVVSFRGTDYRFTVVSGLLMLAAALLVLWLLWAIVTLPLRGLRGFRSRRERARLTEGLDAFDRGEWSRAEKALAQAAGNPEVEASARIAAARAADARGDAAAAQRHLDALGDRHPAARALATAERAMAQHRPTDALVALDAPAAQPLPPRALLLRAQALAEVGRAHDAYGLLGTLRQQQALPGEALDDLQARLSEASLREAADANVLADRWDALPKSLRSEPRVVAAYARRAAALRWDEAAARSIEQALDTRWDERLADLYGRLPISRLDERRGHLQRWLQAHPASPAVLLALARIARAQQQWPQAEPWLHRAIAQGAGSEAWEELGHGYADIGDESGARLAYANALRALRDEPPIALPERSLRQQIHDQAAIEERDEHGMPRLRG
jgi:HemY protein